jgi:predicted transcriptional regulator
LEKAIELLKNPENMADYGLQVLMMLHNSREINLVDSVIDAVYTSVAEMALAKPIEIQEIPDGADEETTDKIKEANEKATETNK